MLSKTGDASMEALLSILELPFWWGDTHTHAHTHTHNTHTHTDTQHTQTQHTHKYTAHVCALTFTRSGHPHHACTLQTHTLGQAQLQYKETWGVAGPPEGGRKASLPALEPEGYWDEELRSLSK